MHITTWKKPIWWGYTLCGSNYRTLWEKRKQRELGKISGSRGRWAMNRQSKGEFSGQRKHSVWYYNDGYMSLHSCPNYRMDNPTHGLWVIMTYQRRFILSWKKKESNLLVNDTDKGGGLWMCGGRGCTGKLCSSLLIVGKPKTALKAKVIKKKKQHACANLCQGKVWRRKDGTSGNFLTLLLPW